MAPSSPTASGGAVDEDEGPAESLHPEIASLRRQVTGTIAELMLKEEEVTKLQTQLLDAKSDRKEAQRQVVELRAELEDARTGHELYKNIRQYFLHLSEDELRDQLVARSNSASHAVLLGLTKARLVDLMLKVYHKPPRDDMSGLRGAGLRMLSRTSPHWRTFVPAAICAIALLVRVLFPRLNSAGARSALAEWWRRSANVVDAYDGELHEWT